MFAPVDLAVLAHRYRKPLDEHRRTEGVLDEDRGFRPPASYDPKIIRMCAVNIGDRSCCRADRVHDPFLAINPDVRLHPEKLLVALLGLMHRGIVLLFSFLVDDDHRRLAGGFVFYGF